MRSEDADSAYRRCRAPVFNYLRRCGVPRESAEELMQATFVVLLDKPDRYDSRRGPLLPFLLGVARGIRLAWLRRAGLEFGIPEIGVVRLHLRPFPGATKVGWVRGTTMHFDLGGQSFDAWSVKEILPEDPDRPGRGSVLYGDLLPFSEGRSKGSYYGGFQPGS